MRLIISADTYLCVGSFGFFLRVCGVGLQIEKNRPLLFSERIGFRRVYRLGRWSLEFLK